MVNKSSLNGDQGLCGEYKWGKTHTYTNERVWRVDTDREAESIRGQKGDWETLVPRINVKNVVKLGFLSE
jgi:hypothetical protein